MRTPLLSMPIAKWGWLPLLILGLWPAAFGQGLGSGTAVAIFRSPDTVLAAVDSKEVYTEYRDGIPSVNDRLSCKLTRLGPWYVVVSGVVSGTNGFDALRDARSVYESGLDFRQLTEHVREKVSSGLR